MEENRLKPMREGYDEKLFNTLYAKTKALRRKLTSEIDYRRFGVDYYEVLSWFDVKFIFIFNKYWGTMTDDILLGHLIKGMQFFKCRILRSAYTIKHTQFILSVEDVLEIAQEEVDNPWEDKREEMVNEVLTFLKKNLSENAYSLLDIKLNPPPYIQKRLTEEGIKSFNKIPNSLFMEYFELGISSESKKFLDDLNKEIIQATILAKSHFKAIPIPL